MLRTETVDAYGDCELEHGLHCQLEPMKDLLAKTCETSFRPTFYFQAQDRQMSTMTSANQPPAFGSTVSPWYVIAFTS